MTSLEWNPQEKINTPIRRDTRQGHSKKVAVCKPGRESSPETNSDTLISDFQSLEIRQGKCLLFKALNMWHFAMAP